MLHANILYNNIFAVLNSVNAVFTKVKFYDKTFVIKIWNNEYLMNILLFFILKLL